MTTSTTRTGRAPAHVAFVGFGPGDPGLLTIRARDYLGRADVVFVDQLSSAELDGLLRPDAELIDAGHGEHGEELTVASRAKLLVKAAKSAGEPGLVIRLMDGDPTCFGGLAEEAQALAKAGIGFEIVPGVSSVGAVPAYAGIPLTAKSATAVHVVTTGVKRSELAAAAADHVTAVLMGRPEQLPGLLADLLAAGRSAATLVALTERGTTTAQVTHVTTLGEAEAALTQQLPGVPTLAVVGSVVDLREQLSWFETKPLFGWNVLVPRTKDQAGDTVDRLRHHGATAVVVPTISVEPPRAPQQMERALRGLVTGRFEWIGFTSVNAVKAVHERFEQFGLDARAFAGLKIAAVGGATAEALRRWGIEPDLMPEEEQSAHGLLEVWPPYDDVLDPINRVFLPRADIATDTLVAGLEAIGWEVEAVTAYRTVRAAPPASEVRAAIKTGEFDAVVFTSSSTVRNLVGIAGKPHPGTVVACIGPATAKTAEEHGLTVDVLAPESSSTALIDALAAYGQGLAAAEEEQGEPRQRPSERRGTARRRAR